MEVVAARKHKNLSVTAHPKFFHDEKTSSVANARPHAIGEHINAYCTDVVHSCPIAPLLAGLVLSGIDDHLLDLLFPRAVAPRSRVA